MPRGVTSQQGTKKGGGTKGTGKSYNAAHMESYSTENGRRGQGR